MVHSIEHSVEEGEPSSSSSSSDEIANSSGYKTPSSTSNTTPPASPFDTDEIDTDMMVTPTASLGESSDNYQNNAARQPRRRRRGSAKLLNLFAAVKEKATNRRNKQKVHPNAAHMATLSNRVKEQSQKLKRQFNKTVRNSPLGMIIEIPTGSSATVFPEVMSATVTAVPASTAAASPQAGVNAVVVVAAPTTTTAAVVATNDNHNSNIQTAVPMNSGGDRQRRISSSSILSSLIVQAVVVNVDGYISDSNSTIATNEFDDSSITNDELYDSSKIEASCSPASASNGTATAAVAVTQSDDAGRSTTIITMMEDKTPNKYYDGSTTGGISVGIRTSDDGMQLVVDQQQGERRHDASCCCYVCHQIELARASVAVPEESVIVIAPVSTSSTIPTIE